MVDVVGILLPVPRRLCDHPGLSVGWQDYNSTSNNFEEIRKSSRESSPQKVLGKEKGCLFAGLVMGPW